MLVYSNLENLLGDVELTNRFDFMQSFESLVFLWKKLLYRKLNSIKFVQCLKFVWLTGCKNICQISILYNNYFYTCSPLF